LRPVSAPEITLAKGKERIKKRARRKKGGEEKKAVASPFVVISPSFGETFWAKKNYLFGVYLAVTFSNIRLDI